MCITNFEICLKLGGGTLLKGETIFVSVQYLKNGNKTFLTIIYREICQKSACKTHKMHLETACLSFIHGFITLSCSLATWFNNL